MCAAAKDAGRVPSDIEVHTGVLQVVLLEARQDQIPDLAEPLREKIQNEGRDRDIVRSIPWISGMKKSRSTAANFYFKPRIYATWGTFDLAAIFVSPDLRVRTYTDSLASAGQNIDMCLLPKRPDGLDASDFNAAYLKGFQKAGLRRDGSLTEGKRFLGTLRLKVNHAAIWPANGSDVDEGLIKNRRALRSAWQAIDTWLGKGTRRQAALGLCLGWNEFIVVGHASSPAHLLDLVLELRQVPVPVRSKNSHGPRVPLFATSLSTFGCDVHVIASTVERLPEVTRHKKPELQVQALLRIAEHIGRKYATRSAGGAPGSYFRPSFHVYPGRESAILKRLRLLQRFWERQQTRPPLSVSWYFEVGKQDLHGPTIMIDTLGDPTTAVAYLTLVLLWLHREKVPGDARFFTSYTRFGQVDSVGENLADELPEFAGGSSPITMSRALQQALSEPVKPVERSLRVLQIPYETAERVGILTSAFCWASQREILAEEIIELAPLFLCLRTSLADYESWWLERSLVPSVIPRRPRLPSEPIDPEEHAAWETKRRLQQLNQELSTLFDAFRTSFNNRHLTSFVVGDIADLNLRFRGSFHQLLSVANLMVDSLVSVLLGPRACVASIGMTAAPEVSTAMDTVLVRLPAHSLGSPILLESIGHEVGHQLMRELIRDAEGGDWKRHRWKRLPDGAVHRQLVKIVGDLQARVFTRNISEERQFLENASDYVERHSLGYTELTDWVQSFMFRAVLASLPCDQDLTSDRARAGRLYPEVPQPDADLVKDAMDRTILVCVADALTRWDRKSGTFQAFRKRLLNRDLETLRETLVRKCVVGPGRDTYEILGHKRDWRDYCDQWVLPVVWLSDPARARVAARFFELLFRASTRRVAPRHPGSAHLWPLIQEAFGSLRQQVVKALNPCLHIRHAVDVSVIDRAVLGRSLSGLSWPERPWRAVPQPLYEFERTARILESGHGSLPRFKCVVAQRGAVVPLDDSTERLLMNANAQFYASLLPLLPGWRKGLLEMIDAVEARR